MVIRQQLRDDLTQAVVKALDRRSAQVVLNGTPLGDVWPSGVLSVTGFTESTPSATVGIVGV